MNLEEFGKHFANLYGRTHELLLPNLNQRIAYLYLASCDLQEAVKKTLSHEIVGIALARIFIRTLGVANFFPGLFLGKGMSRKYPPGYCIYCRCNPCDCGKNKKDEYELAEIDHQQATWGLKRWQEHLNSLYEWQNYNRENNLKSILVKLSSEIAQLLMLREQWRKEFIFSRKFITNPIGLMALEMCDILAWSIAVANFYRMIDLEEVVMQCFEKNCPECGSSPCKCPSFWRDVIDWDTFLKTIRRQRTENGKIRAYRFSSSGGYPSCFGGK